MNLDSQVTTFSGDSSENISTIFWSLWQQYKNDLYRYCLKWMNYNPTHAEDALSRAMLKAWKKVQKYAGAAEEIVNFKAWLTRLTHNLCVDIYRERSRGANRVEDIEDYSSDEEQGLVSFEETPLSAMETDEKKIVIRCAIDNLSTRLRETFILHFYQELSHQEIVQKQVIDCSFLSKSGNKTDGKAYFYNGVTGKSEQGLEIYLISIVEIETRLSYSLSVQQTPSRPQIKPAIKLPQNPNNCWFKKSCKKPDSQSSKLDITRVDDYAQHLKNTRYFFPSSVRYLVAVAITTVLNSGRLGGS